MADGSATPEQTFPQHHQPPSLLDANPPPTITLAVGNVYDSHRSCAAPLQTPSGGLEGVAASLKIRSMLQSMPRAIHVCRFYPYHYAPLISDLAKYTSTMGKTRLLGTGPEDIDSESWAGGHGPVRPLLQLMAVLPPSR